MIKLQASRVKSRDLQHGLFSAKNNDMSHRVAYTTCRILYTYCILLNTQRHISWVYCHIFNLKGLVKFEIWLGEVRKKTISALAIGKLVHHFFSTKSLLLTLLLCRRLAGETGTRM